ncbi:MAG: STAS domain-containing protein [Acidobacteriota bacterium]|nr:STAS domain-containing protein [Acidobacteriota bacterium]
MEIEVAEEREDGALVLLPVGRLDSANARAFEAIVMERVGAGEERLVVDFSKLNFISSSGMRVLLLAAKQLHARQGVLVLCSMQDHIHEVFRISGFDQIIPIRDSREAALAES